MSRNCPRSGVLLATNYRTFKTRFRCTQPSIQTTTHKKKMAPPRGPRGATMTSRETRPSTRGGPLRGGARGGTRGGIQKRRGAPRTDIDGDLDMDAQNKAKKPVVVDPNAPRRSTRSSTTTRGKLTAKHAQTIARHLNGGNSSTLSSRISTGSGRVRGPDNLTWVKVKGLKESKAASNPGGGVQDLIQFLERKATTLANRRPTRPVAIKKVSPPFGRRGRFESDSRWSTLAILHRIPHDSTRATSFSILAA